MKNEKLKIISAGLAGILVGSIGVVGANQAIQAIQNTQIKVSLNGQMQEFKDETTGEVQYPITYQDRTYLPLRNVAQLAGLSVDYDSNNNEAKLINSSCMKRIKLGEDNIILIFGGEGGVSGHEVEVYLETSDVASKLGTLFENGETGGYEVSNDKIYTEWLNSPSQSNSEGVPIGYYYIKDYELHFNADVTNLANKEFHINDIYGKKIVDEHGKEYTSFWEYSFKENEKLRIIDASSSFDSKAMKVNYTFNIEREDKSKITIQCESTIYDGTIVDDIG